jgi:hypothetical protein
VSLGLELAQAARYLVHELQRGVHVPERHRV